MAEQMWMEMSHVRHDDAVAHVPEQIGYLALSAPLTLHTRVCLV